MAVCLIVNSIIPKITTTLYELNKKYKDEDGFLYFDFTSNDVFQKSEQIKYILKF